MTVKNIKASLSAYFYFYFSFAFYFGKAYLGLSADNERLMCLNT